MTPTTNTVEITFNDAPEDFRNKLKCVIMELPEHKQIALWKDLCNIGIIK